jgi:hypothetical protein
MGNRLAVTGVIGELLEGVLGDLDLSVVDGVVLLGREPGFLKQMDLHMLVMLGGRGRTEVEWRDLLAARAFEITEDYLGRTGEPHRRRPV